MKHTPRLVLVTLLAALPLFVGCVGTQMEMQRANLLRRGYSETYADGYAAGYGSGLSAAGNPYAQLTKDVQRYLKDGEYKVGWDDGFNAGKGSYENTARMIR